MKVKARHRLVLLTAALASAAALSAVVAGTAAAKPVTVGGPAASSPFRVLVVTELSGPTAAFGAAYRPGLFAAAHLINGWGGILGHKVTIKFVDDQSNPVTGVTVLQNELASGTTYNVVVTAITAFTQPLAPILAQHDLLALTSGSASALFRGNPYQNLFGFSGNLYSQEQGMVRTMKAKGIKNVGIIGANNAAGTEAAQLLQRYAQGQGMTANIVLTPTTVTDATPQLQQLQSKGADALAIVGFSAVVNAALAARDKLGWTAPAYCDLGCAATNWGTVPAAQLKDVYPEEMPWLVAGDPVTKTKQYQLFTKTLAKYEKSYSLGIVVDLISYDMLLTARAAAIKAHSIDGNAMVKALETIHSSTQVPWYVGPKGLFAAAPSNGYDLPHVIHTVAGDMVFVKATPQKDGMIAGPATK